MRKRGIFGGIWQVISLLIVVGIFLAVLAQFGGDLGAALKWVLDSMWNFVVTIRDTVASWSTFQGLFN